MTTAHKYKVGLVQMRMGADPEANFSAALGHIREAARLGAQIVCLPELFRTQYFCQREELALFDLAEPIPGPSTAKLAEVAREVQRRDRRFALRAPRAGALPQHRGHAGRRRRDRRRLPQDAHPRRSALLREVLLRAGRSGLSGRRHRGRPRGHAGLLGPVVSRGRAAHRAAGRRGAVLSHGHRLAPGGEGRVRRGAISTRGRPSSAPTPSPTASMWRP